MHTGAEKLFRSENEINRLSALSLLIGLAKRMKTHVKKPAKGFYARLFS